MIRVACTFAEKAGYVVRTVKHHEREVPCARGTNHRVLHRVLGSTDQQRWHAQFGRYLRQIGPHGLEVGRLGFGLL